jgi:hypothetical protein
LIEQQQQRHHQSEHLGQYISNNIRGLTERTEKLQLDRGIIIYIDKVLMTLFMSSKVNEYFTVFKYLKKERLHSTVIVYAYKINLCRMKNENIL